MVRTVMEAVEILARPAYVGADADVIAASMTGTFEYEKGDVREVPDFNVFFRHDATYPFYSDAIWYLTQMRRWGQIGEHKDDAWYDETARSVYLPEIYLEAAELLVGEGYASADDFPMDTDGYRAPTDEFIDGIEWDGRAPNSLPRVARDRAQGIRPRRRQLIPLSAPATETTPMATNPASLPTGSVPVGDRLRRGIDRVAGGVDAVGFGWLLPICRLLAGESPREQMHELRQRVAIPLLGIALFLGAWALLAPTVQTSLGAIPGPAAVWEQLGEVRADHVREREKEAAFFERQEARNAKLVADGRDDKVKVRDYTGKPTYLDQIFTSLKTVTLGFVIATLIAIPVGVASGLSRTFNGAINPLIQIFKPVSPLAWLPIVTMIVSAAYVSPSDAFPKALVISAVTVTLCSLWPTLINTALGVASVDKDLMNVGRVLRLPTWKTITRIVMPSAMPLIFTGLRLSLGVGWMVLIAAEMLAQNPGLGKFVWDEFQNGSSDSLARIMLAVITIGLIGFLLDRIMFALQEAFTFSANR